MTHVTSLRLQRLGEKLSVAAANVSNRMPLYNSGITHYKGWGSGAARGWGQGGGGGGAGRGGDC